MMRSPADRRASWLTALTVLTALCAIGSLTAWVVASQFRERAKESIREAKSMDQLSAAVQTPEYRTARRLNTLSNFLFVAFLILLIASVVARKRHRGTAGTLGVALVFLFFAHACESRSRSTEATPLDASQAGPVSFPIDTCTFETFASPEPLSESARALLYAMGTGILNQEQGSLVKLVCPQGESFPAWIDSAGNVVSALYGVSWSMNTVAYSPGAAASLRLWEKKGDEWMAPRGSFEDKTVSLSSLKFTSGTYSLFSGGAISEHSARLLRYFGIAVAGTPSTVVVTLGDSSGTGQVEVDGDLRIVDENRWSHPMQ